MVFIIKTPQCSEGSLMSFLSKYNKAWQSGLPAALGWVLSVAAGLLALVPAAVNAQAAPAASRAIAAVNADLGDLLPSLPLGSGVSSGDEAPAGLSMAAGVSASTVAAALLEAFDAANLVPSTGPPPPVECIPALLDDPFTAFPPASIC